MQILEQFFKAQEIQNQNCESIKYQLLKGWMEILLSNQVKNQPIRCKLGQMDILNLMKNTSIYLKKQINFGGKEGTEMASQLMISKLELADDLFKIILNTENNNQLAIIDLFQNTTKHQQQIKQFFIRLIEWYLLNKIQETNLPQSPSQVLILSISTQVQQLFNLVKDYQEVTKIAIQSLINCCKNQDSILNGLANQLPHFLVHKLNKQWCEILESLFSIWVTSDQNAQFAAFQANGLEFLLDKIGVQKVQDKQSILQNTDLHWDQTKHKDDKNFVFQEEEFANIITVHNQTGQNLINCPPDWSSFKKGNKSKLFVIDMINTFYYEYELVIQLNQPVQLKNLTMGFNSTSVEFQQKVLGIPSSILLEGGMTLNAFQPMGVLQPIPDYGYNLYSVEVFRKNFQKINNNSNKISDQIKTLNYPTVKYLKFIIRRPKLTFIENNSILNGKQFKNVSVSISFLSILGYNASILPANILTFNQFVQKDMALRLIGKLCDPSYTETLNILANNQEFVQKIKINFEMMQENLNDYKNWVVPLFLAIATHNPTMGDWLTQKFLELKKGESNNKLILDIIIISPKYSFNRINMVYQKLIESIQNLVYVDTFCSALRMVEQKQQLNFGKKEVKLIFEYYNQNNCKRIAKLLITLLYHQFDFELLKYTIDLLWKQIIDNKKHQYLSLLGNILVGTDKSLDWLSQEQLENILQKTIKILQEYSPKKHRRLNDLLYFLNCIIQCKNSRINNIIIKYHLQLYKSCKNEKNSELIELEIENYQLIFKILKDLVLGNEKLQDQFISVLIEDLSSVNHKKVVIFAEQFLVPFLNATEDVPICLHPYQFQQKKYAYQGYTSNQAKVEFETKIFNKKEKEIFQDSIKPITDKIFQNKKFQFNFVYEQTLTKNDDSSDINDKICDDLLYSPPFIIILQGKMADKSCSIGIFCDQSVSDQITTSSWDEAYNIPYKENCFLFFCQNEQFSFLQPVQLNSDYFGFMALQENQLISLGFCASIFIEFEKFSKTRVDFDPSQFKPFNLGKNPQNKVPEDIEDFIVQKTEFWTLKEIKKVTQIGQNFELSNLFKQKEDQNPYSNYRNNPVYYLPKEMKVKDIAYNVLQKKHQFIINDQIQDDNLKIGDLYKQYNKNMILDICFNIEKHEQIEETQPQLFSLFETFQKQGGVQKLIEVLLRCLTQWKNKDRSQKWFMWVKEIATFAELDSFFSLFIKNKVCIDLMFKILSQEHDLENDKDKIKKWQDEEQNAVKFSYKILAQVFLVEDNSKIRMQALEKQTIQSIFDRLAYLSKESKRKWVDDDEQEQQQIVQKENTSDSKSKKKTGVGYGSDQTGINQKWNVTEYHKEVALKNEQIQQLLQILENFFNFQDWTPPSTLNDIILQSCLLPLIESDFRSSSLLEMSKFSSIYNQELNIVKLFSQHKSLIPFLQDIDQHYKPRQIESIYSLLRKLKDLAHIFLKVHSSAQKNEQGEKEEILLLAQNIISTLKIVEKRLSSQQQQNEYDDILQLPLDQKYRILLRDLRFDYMNMKSQNQKYNHHYQSLISKNQSPPQSKIIRLAQEFADISTSLPIEHTNSIFVRCDENRVDFMKALIMGAADTPYAHGAFEFDIYFEDSYPNTPPKVNLTTTGGATVRFNPNLYSCGKVCLSLLGTWRGNASENWDPKLSTLLQVLVSIQAIIMSDDVYFNEPGFEGEAGTNEGNDKNEAYCNIVRYCNISFAMIEQIKNPSKGFENVIRRHFYLKKDEIMKECKKWVELSDTKSASYNGLIKDHNSNWCGKFKEKSQYPSMLKDMVSKLEKELNQLQPPSLLQLEEKNQNKNEKDQQIQVKQVVVEKVNVDYDTKIEQKELDFEDDKVKDRWSRNIGVMGIEALKKQAKAKVFMFNLTGLGVEIAKNVVLSGVNRFTIFDNQKTQSKDVNGQFFAGDLNKNRLECIQKIQHLNNYVKVDGIQDQSIPKSIQDLDKLGIKNYDIVVANECKLETYILLNDYCKQNKIKFIQCDVNGVFSRVFSDLGKDFQVLDKNGEECNELIIKNISNEQKGVIELLQGQKHNLEDNDQIIIYNVEGMEKNIMIDKSNPQQDSSINNSIQQITIINKDTLQIGDTTQYSNYIRQGLCKQIKQPLKMDFYTLSELLDKPKFDQNLEIHDFMKLQNQIIIHALYLSMNDFENKYQSLPKPWNKDDLFKFQEIAKDYMLKYEIEQNESVQKIIEQFCYTYQGSFPPLQAFIGGFVAQEIIKALTNKFTPLQQFFYSDCVEVLCDENTEESQLQPLEICLGNQIVQKLEKLNIFMVGVGALGCELLKNFAMLNLGIQAKITITDPDIIELSNLNRQFLFREKHLRMSKSLTACAAVIQMNKKMDNHIQALTEKVCDATYDQFNDQFFEKQNIICNALDNVQARRYMDMRCVSAKIPLLESGTLGPKGHVQVILPNKTESYESQKDPQDEGDIPQCTLKMFPEEAVHCVEWALDKFGSLYTLKPKALIKAIEEGNQLEGKQLKQAIKMLKKRPLTFNDCVLQARQKFQKYFNNNIQQLMYTYPLDCKNKDGALFWSLPKRPPTPIQYDPNNPLHLDMIISMACLRAKVYGIGMVPPDSKAQKVRNMINQMAQDAKIQEFKPSQEKSQQLQNQAENKKEEENQNQNDLSQQEELKELLLQHKKININAEEFEKDDDTNYHIDFIYALAGCRSQNYSLEKMEWINVKLKAGRIIPALATTTACIAALQTLELVKIIKECKLDTMKNAFLNLAVPLLQLIEPGPAPKFKIKEGLEISIWDKWEVTVKKETNLSSILSMIKEKYDLHPKDVFFKSKVIFMTAIHIGEMGQKIKNKSLIELIGFDNNQNYCDLTITFTINGNSNEEIIAKTPIVRVQFE